MFDSFKDIFIYLFLSKHLEEGKTPLSDSHFLKEANKLFNNSLPTRYNK